MRPLAIKVTGLRSHSGTTAVTFPDDWQLAAIVGPTGAGKSSLLEAVVYALFGAGTVPNASQPSRLIADNTREMRVVLTFEVAGAVHEVVRTHRRSGASPPPVLKSPGQILSGVRPVEDGVTRLLGLSPDAFCQTALLPQGRFARLLEAGPSDQKTTLDEFFRLSEVTDVAGRIALASNQVAGGRDSVAIVRRQFPADPVADLAAAEQASVEARQLAATAAATEAEVTRLLSEADKAATRAGDHDRIAAELNTTANALARTANRANTLATLATEMASDESVATGEEERARRALAAARDELEALDARTVIGARTAIGALSSRIHEAADARDDATRLDGQAITAESEDRAVEAEVEAAISDHQRLGRDATEATAAAEQAVDLANEGEALAAADADAAQVFGSARTAAAQATNDLESASANARAAADAHEAAERAVTTANDQARRADEVAASAAESARVATTQADQVATLATAYADAATAERVANGALAASTASVAEARGASEVAAAVRDAANDANDRAEATLAQARQADAAAVAAADAHPGDPCPVCARELPEGFEPPHPPAALITAGHAVRDARQKLDAASGQAIRTRERVESAEREWSVAESQAADAASRLASATTAYNTVGGDSGRNEIDETAETTAAEARRTDGVANQAHQLAAGAAANLKARAEALGPLDDACTRVERAAAAADTALTAADKAANATAAAYRTFGADEALARAQTASAVASDAARAAIAAASAAKDRADQLSERRGDLRVAAGNARTSANAAAARAVTASAAARSAALDVPTAARNGASTDPSGVLEIASEWTTAREAQLEATGAAVSEAQAFLQRSEARLAAARSRRIADHDSPLAEITTAAAGLAAAAGAPMPPNGDAVALGAWATGSAIAATKRAAAERETASGELRAATTARDAALDTCQAAGTTFDELASWRANTDAAVGRAQTSLEQAAAAAERCVELDRALDNTLERHRLLEAGKALSHGRGNFVLHVLSSRRRQLLFEAAAILAELSGQRLVFDTDATDRFSVIDTSTATARDPRLLSGGEQFQASLALALGLVEIAARGGSRIECLFLDEGFAALDTRSLDIALDALETAARRGRRIVAVTHIDAVTTRCDQVLEVRPGTGGSSAAWRKPALL
jgi:exonuclease SbcC